MKAMKKEERRCDRRDDPFMYDDATKQILAYKERVSFQRKRIADLQNKIDALKSDLKIACTNGERYKRAWKEVAAAYKATLKK